MTVRWDFLEEVMRAKRFPYKWVEMVMKTVVKGKVCVNVNGERSNFFRTFRGLRQGDPLSPLLFNIVADALSIMIDTGVKKNHITGVLSDILPGGISHIQYADDTIIMIDGSEKSILNLKTILYCFEWLSGLRINFHKSEVYVFGFEKDEERRANMLNCALGSFPMKYLGIPVSDRRLKSSDVGFILEKMGKRLDPWKGKHLSKGGRLILTNSCLSSLPTYTMGFYLLPKDIHKKMDRIRSNFFWQGAEKKNSFHMAKWDMVTRPKDQGGLGVADTSLMNECLLVKWIWKITQGSDDIWFKLIKAKYMPEGNFFISKNRGASQFWQGLHKVKHLFKWGAVNTVNNGEGTFFWKDTWLGEVPLEIKYPRFFDICKDKDVLVNECYDEEDWSMEFQRPLLAEDLNMWEELQADLQEQVLRPERDVVLWSLDSSKNFTVNSLYKFRTDGGVRNNVLKTIWKCGLPLKIKIFLWQLYNRKVQAATVLKERGWKGSSRCVLCQDKESIDHIFFRCVLSKFLWKCWNQIFNWDSVPFYVEDLFYKHEFMECMGTRKQSLFLLAAMVWAIWRNRNKMAMEKSFPICTTKIYMT
jgi:hypothetical protein